MIFQLQVFFNEALKMMSGDPERAMIQFLYII